MLRHRGFKSLKLSQQRDAEQEEQESGWKLVESDLEARMVRAGARTIGALLAAELRPNGSGYVRARRGVGQAPTRSLIERELLEIREVQKSSAPFDEAAWREIEDLILDQRPIRTPDPGPCTLIETEKRAPRALPSAQRARIRMALANLLVVEPKQVGQRHLTDDEWGVLTKTLDMGGTHTWASLRERLGFARGTYFTIERQSKQTGGKAAGREIEGDATAAALSTLILGWQSMELPEQDHLVRELLGARRERRRILDIGTRLGLNWEARIQLADEVQFGLPRGYLRLGPTAVARMIVDLRPGVSVREVENRILNKSEEERQRVPRLPELPEYEELLGGRIGNVTVHIALGQIRHLVNALIHRHGHPERIVIETTREMKSSADQLREIYNTQAKREKDNEDAIKELDQNGAPGVTRHERLRRWRLVKRQKHICPYTGKCISMPDLETDTYEVDHVIPRAKGGTDALDNLVLCVADKNRRKRDMTPHEAFSPQEDWPLIRGRLENCLPPHAHWRIGPDAAARVKDDGEGWAPRQIHDTSHVARAAMKYLRHVTNDVVASRGSQTAWLRRAWDINIPPGRAEGADGKKGGLKSRFDHRHHFIDAAVIGVTSRAVIQRLNTLHSRHGMMPRTDHPDVDPILGEPFEGFVDQITRRWHLIWPSLRPDHGGDTGSDRLAPEGELHRATLYRSIEVPDQPGKRRLASRRTIDDLFGTDAKPVVKEAVIRDLERLVRPDLRPEFDAELEELFASADGPPTLGDAKKALKRFAEKKASGEFADKMAKHFGPPPKLADEMKVRAALNMFVSARFRDRFEAVMAACREENPSLSLAAAAHVAARAKCFGPRGIGKISVWTDDKIHEADALDTVPRSLGHPGEHRAIVDIQAKAFIDIVANGNKWEGRPVSLFDASKPGGNRRPDGLVARLRKGDLVAWETEPGKREVGWVSVIKGSGQFFVWPLHLARTMEAANALGVEVTSKEGISFSADTLRKKRGRPVTITILGRLRDPRFRD